MIQERIGETEERGGGGVEPWELRREWGNYTRAPSEEDAEIAVLQETACELRFRCRVEGRGGNSCAAETLFPCVARLGAYQCD